MPDFPHNHGGAENGGTNAFLDSLAELPWAWTPELDWRCEVRREHLRGEAATQVTTVTIPALGFVSGRLRLVFSAGPLLAPVTATAYAEAVEEDQDDMAAVLETAIDTLLASTLEGVVASATATANAVEIRFVEGIGSVNVAATWTSAQRTRITWGGTLRDGDYYVTCSSDDLAEPVLNFITRAASVPATPDDLATAMATYIDVQVDMGPIVVSATDDGPETIIQFEPEAAPVDVVAQVPDVAQIWETTVGSTPTNGIYRWRFSHASLFAPVDVDVERSGGSPVDNDALAAQAQTQIEAHPALFALIASAQATGAVNEIITHVGVTGLVVVPFAPSPGMLSATETTDPPTVAVDEDDSPDGPAVTVTHAVELDLNAIAERGRFPRGADRHRAEVRVLEAFGAGRTLALGDADEPSGLCGTSTPVDANTVARSLTTPTDAYYRTAEARAFAPRLTVQLGASQTVTAGRVLVQITWSPDPVPETF